MMRRPTKVTVEKINGLFLSCWNVYRGSGKVTFDPPPTKTLGRQDLQTHPGELWLPPEVPEDGIYDVSVTFDRPGSYTLWGRADDGGLYHDAFITVHVEE